MKVKQPYTENEYGVLMPFFRFYPALKLGAYAVNRANTVKMTSFRSDRDMCIFPAIKTGTHSLFRFHKY